MLNEASGLKGCFLKWFDVVLNQSFHIDLLLFFFLRSLSNLLSNRAFAICVYEFFIFHSRFPSTYDTLCCVLLDQLEQWFVLVLGWGHKNLPLLWSCLSWSRPIHIRGSDPLMFSTFFWIFYRFLFSSISRIFFYSERLSLIKLSFFRVHFCHIFRYWMFIQLSLL